MGVSHYNCEECGAAMDDCMDRQESGQCEGCWTQLCDQCIRDTNLCWSALQEERMLEAEANGVEDPLTAKPSIREQIAWNDARQPDEMQRGDIFNYKHHVFCRRCTSVKAVMHLPTKDILEVAMDMLAAQVPGATRQRMETKVKDECRDRRRLKMAKTERHAKVLPIVFDGTPAEEEPSISSESSSVESD